MTTIRVPFHQDEHLTFRDIPMPADVVVEPALPAGDLWSRLIHLYGDVAAAVAAAGPVPIVVSGDCLIAGATVAGVQRTGLDPAVVWFDAHGDVHTLETTTSGYLGGLSLRLLTGAHPSRYADPLGLRPVSPSRTVLVGARDLDPAESEYLAGSPTRRVTVPELSAEVLPPGPLVVHVDLDVIDPASVPGFRFPAPDGPSVEEVLDAFARVLRTGRVVAWDIACPWFPTADEASLQTRMRLLYALTPYLQ